MSMFGSSYDGNLSSKIDQLLAGRPSAKSKVEEFLVDELHVDPSKIPLSLGEATNILGERMSERDAVKAYFGGSSMGLGYVDFQATGQDQPSGACPLCASASAYFTSQGNSIWECDECEQTFTWTKPSDPVTRYDERGNKMLWSELTRIYSSFLKNVEPEVDGDAPDCVECGASNAGHRRAPHLCEVCEKKIKPKREPAFTKFSVERDWRTIVTGVKDKAPRWKRPGKYPVGTTLKVTDGTDTQWVRVGGLFSDDDITILATMKPIQNPSKWTVTEVLDDSAS